MTKAEEYANILKKSEILDCIKQAVGADDFDLVEFYSHIAELAGCDYSEILEAVNEGEYPLGFDPDKF